MNATSATPIGPSMKPPNAASHGVIRSVVLAIFQPMPAQMAATSSSSSMRAPYFRE